MAASGGNKTLAEQFYTAVDAFGNGVQGYKRLHADELGDEKKVWNKDPATIEKNVMEFVSKTNHEEYMRSMTTYLKKVRCVIGEFGPKMKQFKQFLKEIEERFRYMSMLDAFEKEYADAIERATKSPGKGGSAKTKQGAPFQPLRRLKDKALEGAMIKAIRNTFRDEADKMAKKWEDVWKKLIETAETAQQKAQNQEGEQSYEIFKDSPSSQSAMRAVEAFMDQFRKALGRWTADIPDSYKGDGSAGGERKTFTSDPTISDYMEWYTSDKMDDALRVDEKAAKMVDVVTLARIYKPREDPYRGFSAFLQASQTSLLNFEKKAGSDKSKDVPVDGVKAVLTSITKLENFVGGLASDDVTPDSQKGRVIVSMLDGLVKSAEKIKERQSAYVYSIGGLPKLSEATDESQRKVQQHLERIGISSEGGPSSSTTTSGTGGLKGALTSSSSTPGVGSGTLGKDGVSDDRRKLDAILANDAPRILSRTANLESARMYLDQLGRFRRRLKESNPLDRIDGVLKTTDRNVVAANQDIERLRGEQRGEQIGGAGPGDGDDDDAPDQGVDEQGRRDQEPTVSAEQRRFQVREVGKRKKAVILGMFDNLEALFEDYANLHADFVLQQHRDGLKYMLYWKDISVDNEEFRNVVRDYFTTLQEVQNDVDRHTSEARALYMEAMQGQSEDGSSSNDVKYPALARWGFGMKSDDYEVVLARLTSVNEKLEDVRNDVIMFYEGRGRPLSRVLLAAPFLIMYFIKVVRIVFAWAALHFAEHVFQLWYAQKTYGENADPPHPVTMIGLFVVIDMVMNAALLAVLFTLKALFDTPSSRFPVDGVFLRAFALDYVCTTATVFVLAAVVSQVVKTKKYFRYRYEGERGIRALSTITFYIAVVVLLMPFFRIGRA